MTTNVLPPLRGSRFLLAIFPWAYAHGYVLPSLRDSGKVHFKTYASDEQSEL